MDDDYQSTAQTGVEQWIALHQLAFDAGFSRGIGNDFHSARQSLIIAYMNIGADMKARLDPVITQFHEEQIAMQLVDNVQLQEPDERDFAWLQSYVNEVKEQGQARVRLMGRASRIHAILLDLALGDPYANLMDYMVAVHQSRSAEYNAQKTTLDEMQRRLAWLASQRNRGKLSTDWVLLKELGSGGYGTASAWLKQDHTGRIIDRLAIKDAKSSPRVAVNWTRNGKPMEVETMQRLEKIEEASNSIVRLRSWAIDRNISRYRLYMEFCPFGDLFSCAIDYGLSTTQGLLPEPFAWSVLHTLVQAGILMERGSLRQAVDGWELIVHRDLKLANVFLSGNTSGEFRGYQVAKVGDFGIAVIPSPRVEGHNYTFNQPHNNVAPEVCTSTLRGLQGDTRVSTKTNVWGVGLIMRSLLAGGRSDKEYARTLSMNNTIVREEPRSLESLDPRYGGYYSEDLLEIIAACLAYHPNDRPSFELLRTFIDERTSGGTDELAGGLRSKADGDPSFLEHSVTVNRDMSYPGLLLRRVRLQGNVLPRTPKPRVKRPREDGEAGNISSSGSSLGGLPGREIDMRSRQEIEAQRDRAAAFAAEGARMRPTDDGRSSEPKPKKRRANTGAADGAQDNMAQSPPARAPRRNPTRGRAPQPADAGTGQRRRALNPLAFPLVPGGSNDIASASRAGASNADRGIVPGAAPETGLGRHLRAQRRPSPVSGREAERGTGGGRASGTNLLRRTRPLRPISPGLSSSRPTVSPLTPPPPRVVDRAGSAEAMVMGGASRGGARRDAFDMMDID